MKFLLSASAVYICITISCVIAQNVKTNNIDSKENEIKIDNVQDLAKTFSEAAQALGGEHAGDVGNMINNFIQGDGGKTIGNLLMGAMGQGNDPTSQIISGIGSMLNNNNAGASIDPSVIGNIISAVASSGDSSKPGGGGLESFINLASNVIRDTEQNSEGNFDFNNVVSGVSNMITNSGENPLMMLVSLLNAFAGPDAKMRESEHSGHAFLLPPILEKLHLYLDHFKHTELYKALWRVTGADKFYTMFSTDGKFNFGKFFERLENHSFRRHWLRIITKRITDVIAIVMDPKRHKKYMHTSISVFNGFLKSLNFPKTTLFDSTRPTETLTNLINYFFKKYVNMNIESRVYVKPAVKYVQEIIDLAQQRGFFSRDGIDSKALSNKLTDTINLEVIEPIARVWRAYRFAKKHPECDKYVMCLVNQNDPKEAVSLPGLKTGLSKSASLFISWFLSQKTNTSFWTLYSTIMDEKDCTIRYIEKCGEFHIEEMKVTTEYEHTEL